MVPKVIIKDNLGSLYHVYCIVYSKTFLSLQTYTSANTVDDFSFKGHHLSHVVLCQFRIGAVRSRIVLWQLKHLFKNKISEMGSVVIVHGIMQNLLQQL